MSNTNDEDKKLDDEAVIERAKKRLQIAEDYWKDIYKAAEEDSKFCAGEQWPEDLKRRRDARSQPSLVINKINQSVKQVTNDQRQNRPSIKVSPIDDNADVETARIRQGIIRHIERSSGADAAYDTGFEQAAKGGIGFYRITTAYCNPYSFDQDILIRRVPNYLNCLLDPAFQEPDGSDAGHGFVQDTMPKDKFTAEWPEAKLSKEENWSSLSSGPDEWVSDSEVRVVEYYEAIYEEKELHLLSDGETLLKEELEEIIKTLGALPEGISVVQSKKAIVPSIKWYKIAGSEILERTDIPGQYIPIIPILGAEYYLDGKRVLEGIVRQAKDPQRAENYWASAQTETIALAPKAPWIVAEGAIEGHEDVWETANLVNHSHLPFRSIDGQGNQLPPPIRNTYEPPVQAITQARMQASDDLKATTGLFNASLGAQSNETSGVAIQRRAAQGQNANFHLVDNLTRSIRHGGRIINSWIPTYYDGPRVGRIIGEEGDEEIIKLNQEFKYKGEMRTFNMDVGRYDVAVETGPSFATKRQEAVASMLELTRSYPNLFPIIGDLMIRNMDIPGAQEMSERLKRVAPAGVIDDKDQKPLPPEVQQKLQQQQQMVDDLTKALNQAQDSIDQKTREIESKERIEFKKMQIDLQKAMANLDQKDSALMLQTQIGQIQNNYAKETEGMRAQILELEQRLGQVGFNQPIEEPIFMNEAAPGGNLPAPEPMDQQPTGGFSPGNNMGV